MSAPKAFLAALVAAALATALLFSWASRVPDIEVRNQPLRTHTGAITRAAPVGQAFTCERDGLHRIDVHVSSGGAPAGALEIVLRADSMQGAVLRRAFSATLSGGADFARFDFQAIADSAGKRYAFEIAPSEAASAGSISAYVAYRGFGEDVRLWGDRVATPSELEGEFVCEHPDLRGVAIPFRTLTPKSRTAKIEIWNERDVGMVATRVTESKPRVAITDGWAFFSFPVLADSRWKKLRFRLTVPSGSEPIATEGGLSLVSYHGSGKVSARLGGLIAGGESTSDRDLVFRAWSYAGARELANVVHTRAGRRVWLALAAWSASIFVLAIALRRSR